MRKQMLFSSSVALIVSVILVATFFTFNENNPNAVDRNTLILQKLDLASIVFEPNRGQSEKDVSFLHRGKNYSVLFKNTESVFLFDMPTTSNADIASKPSNCSKYSPDENVRSKKTELSLKLLNSNPNPNGCGKNLLKGRSNYLFGNNPDKWLKDIPHYGKIRYKNVYSGIDLEYYGRGSNLEYDFIVSPGADPGQIRIKMEGFRDLQFNNEGDLIVALDEGSLLMKSPEIYQTINDAKKTVSGRYAVHRENEVSFEIDNYELNRTLVIDPVLVYSSFIGGNQYDTGRGVKTDGEGNIYIAGHSASEVFAGKDNPTGTGDANAFVIKMDPSASSIIYSTFFGGSATDYPNCLDVDAAGHAYIAGQTKSDNFPIANAWQDHHKGGWIGDGENHYDDAFVTKLNPEGNGFIYSTYFGSPYEDSHPYNLSYGCEEATGICTDASGNAYVVGWANSEHLYVTENAYQKESGAFANGHKNDAFLTKFDATGGVVYSTYLGGVEEWPKGTVYKAEADDEATGITVDDLGNMYVTGFTDADSFPVTAGAYQLKARDGYYHCFVSKFNPAGTNLVFSTVLSDYYNTDISYDISISESICIDEEKNIYIAGLTNSENLPMVNAFQSTFAGGPANYRYDAFMAKFSKDGSNLLYSTFWGGDSTDVARAIAVDDSEYVYITGYTNSDNLVSRNGLPNPYGGGDDVFLAKIDPQKTGDASLIYSTYLGGSGNEYGNALTIDHNYNALVTGLTKSDDFPISADAFQPVIDAAEFSPGVLLGDAFISKIGKKIDLRVYPDGVAYDDLHPDTDVGPLQSSFFDLTIEGPNLGNIEEVYFKKLNGEPEDSLIVKNIRVQDTKIDFDLSVLHPATRAPRQLFIKAPNRPEINVSQAIDKNFIVTRIKTFFNQGVDASGLQTHEHRDVSIAHKKGILRIELDDPAFYNSKFSGYAKITGMATDSVSRTPFTYLAGYTEQELIQGKDYLAIPFSPKLSPGELSVDYRLEAEDGLVLFCPRIIREFVESETLNIYTICYTIKYKTDGSQINPPIQPPTEAEVKEAVDYLKKIFPIGGNRIFHTHAGKVVLDKDVGVEEASVVLPSGGSKKIYHFNALTESFMTTLLEFKVNEVNFDNKSPYNIIAAFFPEGTLFEDDGNKILSIEGFTHDKSRIVLLNPINSVDPLAKLGTTLAHEIGHIISSATRNTTSTQLSQFWNLGDEYEGGHFKCNLNPPVQNQKNFDNISSCSGSPYVPLLDGNHRGIYTTLTAYDPTKMTPMLTYLGVGISDKKYNFMGNTPGDSNWVSVKTYDLLMRTLTPNVSKGSGVRGGQVLAGDMLDISGIIYEADSAGFIGFTKSESGVSSPDLGGAYSLELQDVNRSQLASLNFEVEFLKLSNPPVRINHAFFNYRMEMPVGTKRVVLKKNGTEMASKILSDNAPAVQITSPQKNQEFGNYVNIDWTASDPDNDPMTYSVFCSYDTTKMIAVSSILDSPNYRLDASVFPQATNLKIIVFANDGLNIGKDSVNIVVKDPVSIKSEEKIKPENFKLYPNHPNPFNSETTIGYTLPASARVDLSIYNIIGQKIATLVNRNQQAGTYSVNFNAADLVSGVYLCKLQTRYHTEIIKIVLMK